MKIKNQFRISIAIFIIILAVITASVIITEQQTAQLNNQEAITLDIQTGASNLGYISNNYFLYQDNSSLALWQHQFSSLSNDLSNLNPSSSEQQILLNNVKGDAQQLNSVWTNVVSYLENAPRNVSVRVLPEFQTDWSRMAVQNQALTFDAQQLSKAIRNQVDQLNLTDIILIFALLGLFGAYFITNYLITYRNTLKSISELQAGIAVIGSGNLDYSIKADKKDEIGEVSKSFNQMTTNLKTMTASKADLEGEIAEREKAEVEVAQVKQRLEAHMNNSPEAVIEFDSQFRVIRWSEEAQRIFGWSAEEIIGRSMTEMPWVYKDDVELVQQVSGDMLSGKRPRNVNSNRNYRKDGSVIYCEWYNSAIYDANRKLTSVLSQVLDVTERKQMQERLEAYAKNLEGLVEERTKALKDAERLAAIGATAGMVGHDIRNPLQGITSDVYLVKSDLASMPEGEAKDSMKESLEGIGKNVEYINKIVQDLQDYAKPIKPTLQETDFESLCQEVLFNNGVPENINAVLKVEKQAKKLVADPELLKRILSNLVNNAVQAMPEGGKLAIHAYKKADNTVITVQDSGVGIPEEIKPKLFMPLFTTKSKGQGFGLAVVKRVTEALGGTVSFESEQGKGTKFIIRLPQKK